jgi:hypothetical protein
LKLGRKVMANVPIWCNWLPPWIHPLTSKSGCAGTACNCLTSDLACDRDTTMPTPAALASVSLFGACPPGQASEAQCPGAALRYERLRSREARPFGQAEPEPGWTRAHFTISSIPEHMEITNLDLPHDYENEVGSPMHRAIIDRSFVRIRGRERYRHCLRRRERSLPSSES